MTKWNLTSCKEVALKYKTSKEWKRAYKASYNAAIEYGWLKECTAHMTKLKGAWNTLEKCKEIAIKFNSKTEWRTKHNSSYMYAHRKRWVELCCSHMKKLGGTSYKEQELLQIVRQRFSNANCKRFKVTDKKYVANIFELDIYIPDLNKGIEFNGKYWHSFEGLKRSHPTWNEIDIINYHKIKQDFFNSIGIELLMIEEKDWNHNKTIQINNVLDFIGDVNA